MELISGLAMGTSVSAAQSCRQRWRLPLPSRRSAASIATVQTRL